MMRFNPGAFDRHLANIGQKLLWRRSYACACVSANSGAPDPRHALCAGKGRIWDKPVPTVAGVASQSTMKELIKAGFWEKGDMVLSIPQASPMWDAVGQFDRVTMLNATDMFSQPMTRNAPGEKFMFTPVKIDRVFWLHPQTRAIVEGRAPVVAPDGSVSWPNGLGEPPPGAAYSVTGSKYDEFFIFDSLPSDRNQHSGMRLPKKVQARKWDLLGRGGVSGMNG